MKRYQQSWGDLRRLSTIFVICYMVFSFLELFSESLRFSKGNSQLLGKELFLNDFHVALYEKPNKSSRILTYLSYGEPIKHDSEYLWEGNGNWIPILDRENLSGYVMKEQVLFFSPKKKFSRISHDVNNKLDFLSKHPNFVSLSELTDYLFDLVSSGEFLGDEYLFFKLKAGVALGLVFSKLDPVEIDESFTVKYSKYIIDKEIDKLSNFKLTPHASQTLKQYRLDENYFWKQASLHQKSVWGDRAGQLAVEFFRDENCRGETACVLNWLNAGYLKYLAMFPRGKKSVDYSRKVVLKMENWLSHQDQVVCFPPLPKEDWRSLSITEYRSSFLPRPYSEKMKKLLVKLRKECFPVTL